jgi:hypothetical protein
MPIGLESHTVSLTKNGYFKLIELIRKYPAKEILDNIQEIRLDRTQGRKMLAGDNNEKIPDVWDQVKSFDHSSQESLLLFSIIFSHVELITQFKNARTGEMVGTLRRANMDDKVYTNLAYALSKAGLAVGFAEGATETKYDLSPIFTRNEIGPLAKTILEGHLRNMGWKGTSQIDPFERSFEEQIKAYGFHDVFGVTAEQFQNWLAGKNVTKQKTSPADESTDITNAFLTAVESAGLTYSKSLVNRFIGSILTKPFVILCGLSGSGKTKLAQSFARWICKEREQYTIVPVGSDWTNREPLLGYPNALNKEEYVRPDSGVLDTILHAIRYPLAPHFIILDEMNLSHVERYFADFLSSMESNEPIPLYSGQSRGEVPANITLPPNLFVIGTVNIDETTNMFSPKVLDRANTIEFRLSESEMQSFLSKPVKIQLSEIDGKGANLSVAFLELATASTVIQSSAELNQTLLNFFEPLKACGAEFGYRTAYEIHRLIYFLSLLAPNLNDAEKVDAALLQKLLPKVHGSRRKLTDILLTLGRFCVTQEVADIEKDVFSNQQFDLTNSRLVKYPLTLEKLGRMYRSLIHNGFTSFAEA